MYVQPSLLNFRSKIQLVPGFPASTLQIGSPALVRHAVLASLASSPPNRCLGFRMIFTASLRTALNAAHTSLRPREQQTQRGAGS